MKARVCELHIHHQKILQTNLRCIIDDVLVAAYKYEYNQDDYQLETHFIVLKICHAGVRRYVLPRSLWHVAA
jgi:hypothetical protein